MKKAFAIIMAALLLTGCAAHRGAVQIVEHATHDTLYVNTLKYDSIYIDRYREVEHKPDTIIIHDKEREYRYRLLHDTTRIVKVDSIPVIQTVEKPVKYIPAIYKWALGIWILAIVIAIMIIVIRIVNLRVSS